MSAPRPGKAAYVPAAMKARAARMDESFTLPGGRTVLWSEATAEELAEREAYLATFGFDVKPPKTVRVKVTSEPKSEPKTVRVVHLEDPSP
jgi:hypothetical protein